MEGWVDLVDLIAPRPVSNQRPFDHQSDAEPLHHEDNNKPQGRVEYNDHDSVCMLPNFIAVKLKVICCLLQKIYFRTIAYNLQINVEENHTSRPWLKPSHNKA